MKEILFKYIIIIICKVSIDCVHVVMFKNRIDTYFIRMICILSSVHVEC